MRRRLWLVRIIRALCLVAILGFCTWAVFSALNSRWFLMITAIVLALFCLLVFSGLGDAIRRFKVVQAGEMQELVEESMNEGDWGEALVYSSQVLKLLSSARKQSGGSAAGAFEAFRLIHGLLLAIAGQSQNGLLTIRNATTALARLTERYPDAHMYLIRTIEIENAINDPDTTKERYQELALGVQSLFTEPWARAHWQPIS